MPHMSEHNKQLGCGYTGHRISPGSVVMVEKAGPYQMAEMWVLSQSVS